MRGTSWFGGGCPRDGGMVKSMHKEYGYCCG